MNSVRSPLRKSAAVLHCRLQWFLPRHAETDGTYEASSQTQHLFPVSQPSLKFLRLSICHLVISLFFSRCESCRTKLRSYRGLLTHLHTCSKVPRGKTKSTEPTPPQPAAGPNLNVSPTVMEQDPPHLDSQLTSQVPNPDGLFPTAVNHPDSAAPPVLGPPFLSHSETSASQLPPQPLAESAPQLLPRNGASNMPPPLNLDRSAAASDPPDSQEQNQTQSTSSELVHPAPGSAPHSPSGSSAVWKRNQGEHTAVTSWMWWILFESILSHFPGSGKHY